MLREIDSTKLMVLDYGQSDSCVVEVLGSPGPMGQSVSKYIIEDMPSYARKRCFGHFGHCRRENTHREVRLRKQLSSLVRLGELLALPLMR